MTEIQLKKKKNFLSLRENNVTRTQFISSFGKTKRTKMHTVDWNFIIAIIEKTKYNFFI